MCSCGPSRPGWSNSSFRRWDQPTIGGGYRHSGKGRFSAIANFVLLSVAPAGSTELWPFADPLHRPQAELSELYSACGLRRCEFVHPSTRKGALRQSGAMRADHTRLTGLLIPLDRRREQRAESGTVTWTDQRARTIGRRAAGRAKADLLDKSSPSSSS